MYILIDCEKMRILYKHKKPEVVANLGWIECQNSSYHIFDIFDTTGLRYFTNMELSLLYKNTTNEKAPKVTRNELLKLLLECAINFNESDVNPFEVDVQASLIGENETEKWKYIKGSNCPATEMGLFKTANLNCGNSKNTGCTTNDRNVGGVKGKPTAIKTTSNKNLIWSIADSMWGEIGKPSEKEKILKLRRGIMDRLENDYLLKRTSVSSELGKWHKERSPF